MKFFYGVFIYYQKCLIIFKMKNKYKKILLSGFENKQINHFKKKYNNINFYNYNKIKTVKQEYDAFVSINRRNFEIFYESDYEKLKNNLSWIHISAAGLDLYPKLFNKNKFILTNGKIIQGPEVADHAIALLLALTRNLNIIIKYGSNKKFHRRPIELKNKKILIIGFGGVGKCIADRAIGFDMKVSVMNDYYKPTSKGIENFYLKNKYKKALKDKDVVVYAVPLTKKTKNMYNLKTAKYFKRGAILINVCRGGVVCEKALYKNLKSNYLRGAGVDVLGERDRLSKNNKFNKLKNFIFTPHIAGISDNLKFRNYKLISDNIYNYVKNKKLINIVKKSDLK